MSKTDHGNSNSVGPSKSVELEEAAGDRGKQCKEKECYRSLYEVDLTQSVDLIKNQYGAVLSSGTFTHGHLGTESFVALLEVAKPGALFVIAVNKAHYIKLGFSNAIDGLAADKRIESLNVETVNIYAKSDHVHASDEGLIVSFRRL